MPTPPGFGDCSLRFTLAGFLRPAYITFGIDASGTNPNLVAGEVYTAATAASSLMSQMDSTVTLVESIVRLGTDGGEDLVGNATGSTVGGLTGGAPPPNVAVLAHKRTARGGRRGRGRWYLPWYMSANDVGEDGVIIEAKRALKQSALNAFTNNLSTGGNPLVVLHNPGISSPGAPDVVTSIVVSNVVGTQRRRLGR